MNKYPHVTYPVNVRSTEDKMYSYHDLRHYGFKFLTTIPCGCYICHYYGCVRHAKERNGTIFCSGIKYDFLQYK